MITYRQEVSTMDDYGLVFSGGGARGAYQIGVWEALNELNIHPSAVVGTSIGAINGVFYAQQTLESAKEIWKNLDASQVFGEQSHNLFMNVEPLRALLEKYVDEDAVRRSPIRFGLATYNLSARQTEYRFIEEIPKGQLVSFILASANVPIFKREVINNQLYVDGGVTDSLPFKMLLKEGYTNIITVMIDIHGASKLSQNDLEKVVQYEINHSENLGGFLAIDHHRFQTNFKMGFYDTKKYFKAYSGYWYYLNPTQLDCELTLHKFSKNDVHGLNKNKTTSAIIKSPMILRRLFLHLVLTKFWKTQEPLTWENLFLSACELTAELLGLPRYQEYTLEELMNLLLEYLSTIENSKEFITYCEEPIPVRAYSHPQDLLNKSYYTVAMVNNNPLFPGITHGASLVAPDIIIGTIVLVILRNRNKREVTS